MFQRSTWHSGLTYRQQCPNCMTVVDYNDYQLGYRYWFADGFVYCPRCKKPLRHHENNAINPDGTPYYQILRPVSQAPTMNANPGNVRYCSQCGNPYEYGKARFCTKCGNELNE